MGQEEELVKIRAAGVDVFVAAGLSPVFEFPRVRKGH